MTEFRRFVGDGSRARGGRTSVLREERGNYIASATLATAVNTALAVERPLLLTGEPGCGKSSLAYAVADELGLGVVLPFSVRSDSVARDLLYSFDHLGRLYDAQTNKAKAEIPTKYRTWCALGEAIDSATQRVVLIDEIDKAPRDFPNDLLSVIDEMDFRVPETDETVQHKSRPFVVVTSNSERQLPEPFLRRCVYHHIDFPDEPTLRRIVAERVAGDALASLRDRAVARFVKLRAEHGPELVKQPGTAELIGWVRVLERAGVDADTLAATPLRDLYPGVLLKTREDLDRLTR